MLPTVFVAYLVLQMMTQVPQHQVSSFDLSAHSNLKLPMWMPMHPVASGAQASRNGCAGASLPAFAFRVCALPLVARGTLPRERIPGSTYSTYRLLMNGDGQRHENQGGGRLAQAMDRWLDKVESKSQKTYGKICSKAEKLKARVARLSNALSSVRDEVPGGGKVRKRDRLLRAWQLSTASPMAIVLSVCALSCAVAGLSMAFGTAMGFIIYVLMLIQILSVTLAPAGMLLAAGGMLITPLLLNVASSTLTVATFIAAVIIAYVPRTRRLPGLSLATLLPLANLWLASQPVHSFEVVKSMRVFDPLAPIMMDPFFRPILPDVFMSDFLDLVPNPFLLRGPTVFIETTTTAPLFALKAAVSLAALALSTYYWHHNRAALKDEAWRLLPAAAREASPSSFAVSSSPSASASSAVAQQLDSIRTEFAKEDMSRWESAYNIRPPPSDLPAEWTVDDLCYMLERRGLASCSEAVRRAGIDGAVALTITSSDEEEVRNELGMEKLGERRRLLLFFDQMRAMQRKQEEEKDNGVAGVAGAEQ